MCPQATVIDAQAFDHGPFDWAEFTATDRPREHHVLPDARPR